MTNYANRYDQINQLNALTRKYCNTATDAIYMKRLASALESKTDEVYHLLLRNGHNPPLLEDYFYELRPFGQYNRNSWPTV